MIARNQIADFASLIFRPAVQLWIITAAMMAVFSGANP